MAGEATIGLGGDIGTTVGIMADGTGGADAAGTVVAGTVVVGMAADGTAIIEQVIACGTGEQVARGCAGRFPPLGVAQGVVFGSDYDRRVADLRFFPPNHLPPNNVNHGDRRTDTIPGAVFLSRAYALSGRMPKQERAQVALATSPWPP
jgi:hypothetical protein